MPLIDVAAGSVIAGYRIEELAGRGGMGVVYRATQLALDRQVALKLIAPEFANDALFRRRFKRESRLAASIDHPNVIPVHEAGDAEGLLFISMRWAEGTDLDTLIRRGGGLEPERAVALVAQIGAALDAAHGRGLIHRDVKPGNVLVVPGSVEHVYLTDFGLVKRLRTSAALTRSGQLLGTLDYVAPEQIQRTGGDARSDVYSLGCVLFHCLTGRVPFETDDDVAKLYAHVNDSPPAPSELAPGLPPGLDLVVAHAMAKEPERRFASAGELGRAAVEAVQELAWSRAGRSTAWGAGRRRYHAAAQTAGVGCGERVLRFAGQVLSRCCWSPPSLESSRLLTRSAKATTLNRCVPQRPLPRQPTARFCRRAAVRVSMSSRRVRSSPSRAASGRYSVIGRRGPGRSRRPRWGRSPTLRARGRS